jgi:dTDP-4-amino-4,6-dideoxygalactose transaminase
MARKPAITDGTRRPLITDSTESLLGPEERESLLATFDAIAARGGREADEVEVFENALAEKFGVAYAVATVSATAALHLTFSAHGIGPGDEVLVSPYSFAATAHSIVHAGATPVFTDIDLETLCISPERARGSIGRRTKAILAVQIGGKAARMAELKEIADQYGLLLFEDAAQAHGSRYRGRYVGALANAGVLSFSPKLMTSGRGGAILTEDPEFAEMCRKYRFHGLPGHRNRVKKQVQLSVAEEQHFVHELPGYSLAMTAFQAAVLMPQINKLDTIFEKRHHNAMYFAERLAKVPGVSPVLGLKEGRSNFYMLEVLYDASAFAGLTRDEFVTALSWEGVPVSPVSATHMLQYDNPSLAVLRNSRCPVAEKLMDDLVIFGHPLQSLIFNGDRAYLDEAADAVELVASHAALLTEHFRMAREKAVDRPPAAPA